MEIFVTTELPETPAPDPRPVQLDPIAVAFVPINTRSPTVESPELLADPIPAPDEEFPMTVVRKSVKNRTTDVDPDPDPIPAPL
jgi:hypothetical protein